MLQKCLKPTIQRKLKNTGIPGGNSKNISIQKQKMLYKAKKNMLWLFLLQMSQAIYTLVMHLQEP